MTITNSVALFLLMGMLAALPSSSVLLVTTRSAIFGTGNGLATAAGIVAGDLVFMTMAILGMTALAEQVGAFFVLIKYLAAAYLIWFGIGLIRAQRQKTLFSEVGGRSGSSGGDLAASFGSGLLLTLGDVKAIFFYASLLPTFLDLAALTGLDILVISAITITAVGGVKAAYAVGARKMSHLARNFAYERQLKLACGGLTVSAGTYLMLKD